LVQRDWARRACIGFEEDSGLYALDLLAGDIAAAVCLFVGKLIWFYFLVVF
jgi:hypothetical protein